MIQFFLQIYNSQEINDRGFSLWDFTNTIVGSLLGFLGAWLIFRSTINRDKQKDEQIKFNFSEDKLHYFASFISDIIPNLKHQSTLYKNVSVNIKAEPYKIHLLEMVTKNDIERLVKSTVHEEFYHSYLLRFGRTTQQVKQFKNIYNTLDRFWFYLTDAINVFSLGKEKIFKSMLRYKEALETLEMKIASKLGPAFQPNDPFVAYLNDLFDDYMINKQDPSDLLYFHDKLLIPLRDKIMNDFPNNLSAQEYAFLAREAIISFNQIKRLSEQQADEMYSYAEEIDDEMPEFENLTKDLLAIL